MFLFHERGEFSGVLLTRIFACGQHSKIEFSYFGYSEALQDNRKGGMIYLYRACDFTLIQDLNLYISKLMSETSQEEEKSKKPEEETEDETEVSFDAVDLMLQGDLKSQINYSMIKGIADALDDKAKILIEAEESYEPQEEETFAEVAMPEIEAMAQAITQGCVNFSKIRFWEACETAEVAWEETKDADGKVVSKVPFGDPLEKPREGNRILANLKQIATWLEEVHSLHEKNGMGWVSPYGCPEDGQQAYDNRANCINDLSHIIESIEKNFDA